MKGSIRLIVVLAVVAVLTITSYFYLRNSLPGRHMNVNVSCTMEAKQCPDGSWVGRTSPTCEFEPCPNPDVDKTNLWKTYTDTNIGVLFKYPEVLPTSYINAWDWPPKAQVVAEGFSCTPAGSETDRTGATSEVVINNRTYCITKSVEGAAGSIFTQYAFASAKDNNTIILTFSTKSIQCGNYPDRERKVCEMEIASFNLDNLVDQMFQTLKQL